MQDNSRRSTKHNLFIGTGLVIVTVLLVAGCSAGESSTPSPTPTLVGLTVPTVGEQIPLQKEGVPATTTAASVAPTTVPYAPTAAVPDATDQVQAEQTMLDAEATETVERTSVPWPVQTNEATVEPAVVDMTTAWGPTPGIVKVPVALDKDSMFVLDSVDPDGRFVVGAIVSRSLDSMTPARLVMVDVKDGHLTEITQYVGPDGGSIYSGPPPLAPLFGADTDGETVVWNDKDGMRAYTIDSGAIRSLPAPPNGNRATPTPTALVYPPTFRAPRVDHGVAVWREYAYIGPNNPIAPTRIMKADLTTGDVTVLSTYGTEPAIAWPYVGWVEYSRSANELTLPYHGTITLLNLQTGVKTSLSSIIDPATFGLSADVIVYSRTWGQGFLTDLSGASSKLISGESFAPYQYISLNDRIATWLTSPPQVVYDRAKDTRVYLANDVPLDAMQLVKGHVLTWQTTGTYVDMDGQQAGTILPNDQSVFLLDTNKLPK